MVKYSDIVWEEDDSQEVQQPGEAEESNNAFAAMLAASESQVTIPRFETGSRIRGIVQAIPSSGRDALISIPQSSATGIIEMMELCDDSGQTSFHEGDEIEAYVVNQIGCDVVLSLSPDTAHQNQKDLESAIREKTPIKGKVTGLNKGGLEVKILGMKAFCPMSKIDKRFVEDPSSFVGRDLVFIIEQKNGRELVVSRRAVLEMEQKRKLEALKASLRPDLVLEAKVSEIKDYGVFVDLGGIDGFVHISELSHSHLKHPKDYVTIGEMISVKVLSVEETAGKPKIALSMKQAQSDPWEDISTKFKVFSSYEGKVTRLASFGAFVELSPGVEGLIHISEMSFEKRVLDPSEIVRPGEQVQVRILEINPVKQRISLTLKMVEDNPWYRIQSAFPKGSEHTGRVVRLKDFGAFVELKPGVEGLLPLGAMKRAFGESYRKHCSPPKDIQIVIHEVDPEANRISLSLPGDSGDDAERESFDAYQKTRKAESTAARQGKEAGSFGALLLQEINKNKGE